MLNSFLAYAIILKCLIVLKEILIPSYTVPEDGEQSVILPLILSSSIKDLNNNSRFTKLSQQLPPLRVK